MELFSLCIKIFVVRSIDVALGTIGTIITIKGSKFISSIIGFIEAFIWFLVVREALTTDLKSIWIALSYSLGYSIGTYLGAFLSKRFINSLMQIQVILDKNKKEVIKVLKEKGYALTVINVESEFSEKYLLLIEIHDKRYNELLSIIKSIDPKAFIIASENKYVINGYFGKRIGKTG